MIREGILRSQRVNALTDAEEVFYRRLLSVADDYGLFEAAPRQLTAQLYSGREIMPTEANVASYLAALEKVGLVTRFEWRGHNVGLVARFRQRIRSKPLFGIPEARIADAEAALFSLQNSYDGHMTVICRSYDGHVSTPFSQGIDLSMKDMTVMSVHPEAPSPSPYSPPHPPYTPPPPPVVANACAHEGDAALDAQPAVGNGNNNRPGDASVVEKYLRSLPTLRIIPEEIPAAASKFFDSMEAAGWVDAKGRNIWNWKAAARLFAGAWQNHTPTKQSNKNYYET